MKMDEAYLLYLHLSLDGPCGLALALGPLHNYRVS